MGPKWDPRIPSRISRQRASRKIPRWDPTKGTQTPKPNPGRKPKLGRKALGKGGRDRIKPGTSVRLGLWVGVCLHQSPAVVPWAEGPVSQARPAMPRRCIMHHAPALATSDHAIRYRTVITRYPIDTIDNQPLEPHGQPHGVGRCMSRRKEGLRFSQGQPPTCERPAIHCGGRALY